MVARATLMQGRGMERPLDEGDVAQRLEPVRRRSDCAPARRHGRSPGRRAGRTRPAGPPSHAINGLRSAVRIASSVSSTKPTSSSSAADQVRQVAADVALDAGVHQQRLRQRGIAAARRQDQRAQCRCRRPARSLPVQRGRGGHRPGSCGTPRNTPWKSTSGSPTCRPSVDPELADRVLVLAGALLDHRDRPLDRAARLEEAQHDHRVGEIGDVDRRAHVAHHPRAAPRSGRSTRRAGSGTAGSRACAGSASSPAAWRPGSR